MPSEDADGDDARLPIDRRTVLSVTAGATAAGLGIGGLAGNVAAWKRFDVEFKSENEVWMIVGNDISYDPPAVAHVIVETDDGETCRLVEFTEENATTERDQYGDNPVVKYDAGGDRVLGVLPYNRPFEGDGRFSRPRCVMKNDEIEDGRDVTALARDAECVQAAMQEQWDGDFRECWFDPLDDSGEEDETPPSKKTWFAPLDASDGQAFGSATDVSGNGDLVVVGAPGDDERGPDAGAVYVFSKRGAAYKQAAKLLPESGTDGGALGHAVDLNDAGDKMVVGAPGDGAGAAYLFVTHGDGWQQDSLLRPEDASNDAKFGASVAFDAAGEYLLVGSDEGAYGFADDDGWTLRDRPTLPEEFVRTNDLGPENRYGKIVTLDGAGDTAIMSQYDAEYGQVNVFTREEDGWSHVEHVGFGGDSHRLGIALDIDRDGEIGILGSDVHTPITSMTEGYAKVVSKGSDSWESPSVTLRADDGREMDRFGRAVALDATAEYALIGSPRHDPEGETNAGAAYLFARDGSSWYQVAKVTPDDELRNAEFGILPNLGAVSGLFGGLFADVDGPRNGADEADLGGGLVDARFGESVALDSAGTTGVIGAPQAEADGTVSGTVTVVDLTKA